MAIASSDKLVVVKSFAPSNPLPLDARELYDSLAEAQAYAKSSAIAYAGQTIKVVENDVVTVYTLVPSSTAGSNYDLSFVGGGTGTAGVAAVGASTVEGNVKVSTSDGKVVSDKNVPVVGALINPVVDEDAHTLTLTKVGATENSEVVVPLGGASPDNIISGVEQGEDGLTIKVTKFDKATETSTTETVKIFGAVTGVDASVAGILDMASTNAAGATAHTKAAMVGAVVNAKYDSTTKILTLPVVTGKTEAGVATTSDITVDMKGIVAGAFVDVTTTADSETTSAKHTFSYKDAAGANKTKDIFEGGVRKVEAGTTVDKVKITVADSETGALTSSEILVGAGNVKNPTYDAETRKITLPTLQVDGTTTDLVINLGKDMVVTSGAYNTTTHDIELTLIDGSVIKIAAGDLIDVYIGSDNQTALVTVSDDNKISVAVKVSTDTKNLVKVDSTNGGLIVKEEDFTDTKKLISDGDTKALQDAKDYADKQDSTNLTAAKTYADGKAADALAAAKTYAEQQAAAAGTTWVDFGAKA